MVLLGGLERLPLARDFREDNDDASLHSSRKGEQNLFWPTSIKWFAKSSGTTNAKSKFIPVSNEALNECHFKAGKDMLSLYFNNNPNSQLFQGKALRLGGVRAGM